MLFDIPGISALKVTPIDTVKVQKALNSLVIGQIVKALVVSNNSHNRLMLNINGQNINAETNHQFKPGDLLDLKVAQTGKQTVLQVLIKELAPQLIHQAQKKILPQQKPATQLLAFLNQLQTAQNSPHPPPLPQAITIQIKNLLNSIASKQQLTQTNRLQQAVRNNGIFLEHKLVTSTTRNNQGLGQDFKAQLLQLFKLIEQHMPKRMPQEPPKLLPQAVCYKSFQATTISRPTIGHLQTNSIAKAGGLYESEMTMPNHLKHDTLPLKGAFPQPIKKLPLQSIPLDNDILMHELKSHIQSSISRIQANQLASLSSEHQINYLLDIPIKTDKGFEVIPLLIEEQENDTKSKKKNKTWAISLSLDLTILGGIQIKAALIEDNLHLNFWLEKSETLQLIENKKDHLNIEIECLNLTLSEIRTHLGLKQNAIEYSNNQLLDLRI